MSNGHKSHQKSLLSGIIIGVAVPLVIILALAVAAD